MTKIKKSQLSMTGRAVRRSWAVFRIGLPFKAGALSLALMTVLSCFTLSAAASQTPLRPIVPSEVLALENAVELPDTALPDAYDLSTLDNTPDPLAGIEGLHPTRVPLNAISPDTLKTFVSVIDLVRRQYVNDVNDERLFLYAMSGMLSKLDGHAEFLDETALKNLQAFTDGSVADVGLAARYDSRAGHWVVDAIVPESSADLADIQLGDYLHQINDVRLNERHSDDDVAQLLSGIAGTQVDVVVSQAGRGRRSVSLQRNQVAETALSVRVIDGIAIVRVPVFNNQTKDELIHALSQAGRIHGVVLDVRNNPGGVLASAIEVASLFMSDRPVLQVVGRSGQVETLSSKQNISLQSLPVMVVQNRYSASAAEVLAAALKLDGQAIIAGETSYGKGSIQSVLPLENNYAVKLTTAHYQMADGTKIDGVGVKPNLPLDFHSGAWLLDVVNAMQDKRSSAGVIVSLAGQ